MISTHYHSLYVVFYMTVWSSGLMNFSFITQAVWTGKNIGDLLTVDAWILIYYL